MEGIRSGSDAACRRPEDDHEVEAQDASTNESACKAASSSSGGRPHNPSETPKLVCSLDKDWDAPLPHETFGPPAFGPWAPAAEPQAAEEKAATPPPATLPAPKTPEPTGNNAARTSGRDVSRGPYASAGYSPDGHSVYAGVAIAKGKSATRGVETEANSLSAQLGAQNEVQGTAMRISAPRGAVTVEAATMNVHVGLHNGDGSTGLNIGAAANAAAIEGTAEYSGYSVTGGLSFGEGAEVSIGVRDKDGDGKPELCVRQAAGPITVGACIEFPIRM